MFDDFIDENSYSQGLKSFNENSFPVSFSKIVRDEEEYNDKWITIAQLDKSNGTLKDGFRYYSLLIRALDGNDANGFDVFLSSSSDSNVEIQQAKILSYEPTLRIKTGAGRYTFRLEQKGVEFSYNDPKF